MIIMVVEHEEIHRACVCVCVLAAATVIVIMVVVVSQVDAWLMDGWMACCHSNQPRTCLFFTSAAAHPLLTFRPRHFLIHNGVSVSTHKPPLCPHAHTCIHTLWDRCWFLLHVIYVESAVVDLGSKFPVMKGSCMVVVIFVPLSPIYLGQLFIARVNLPSMTIPHFLLFLLCLCTDCIAQKHVIRSVYFPFLKMGRMRFACCFQLVEQNKEKDVGFISELGEGPNVMSCFFFSPCFPVNVLNWGSFNFNSAVVMYPMKLVSNFTASRQGK